MARIKDLDNEGVWGEVMYPSLGIWTFNVRTPRVVKEGCRALNDWALDFQHHSPRFVCVASIPLIDINDAVAEVNRARGRLPARLPAGPAALGGPTGTTTCGSRCGRPLPRPAWSWPSTSAPKPKTPRSAPAYLPRAGRGRAQLRRDHLRRPAGRHHAGHLRRPRPPPRPQGAHLRGRRHLGALHRRPHGRGLPPARGVRAAQAVPPAQRDHLRAGLRLLPARQVGRPGPHRPWATRTSCGAATTPTWKAPSGTPRRSCTSSSTTWTRRSAGVSGWRLPRALPERPPPPED